MRRFERAELFWEVEHADRTVAFRWGTPGRPVQRVDRTFASAADAARHAEQQIAAQLAKGYVEVAVARPPAVARDAPRDPPLVRRIRFERPAQQKTSYRRYPRPAQFLILQQTGDVVAFQIGELRGGNDLPDADSSWKHAYATLAEATAAFDAELAQARSEWRQVDPDPHAMPGVAVHEHPELAAQCLQAADDDPVPWTIYADWLIARGDPRGELAALSRADHAREAATAVRSALQAAGIDHPWRVELAFRHGFARAATIVPDRDAIHGLEPQQLAELTRVFLAMPLARFVTALRFGLAGSEGENDWAPTLRAVIAARQAAQIRELRFDAYSSEDCMLSWVGYGDFTGLLAQLPALELVHIKSGAGGTLGELDVPALRTFIRESSGLGAAELAAIRTARWPRLEHLEIWFGAAAHGGAGSSADLERIVDGRDLPALTHLGIVNCELVEDAIAMLARSRVLPRLHSLDLSRGILARRGAELLVEHAWAFRHLAAIDLSDNMLADDEVAAIRAVLDNVIVGGQRIREDDYEELEADGDGGRYVAVGE